MTSALWQLPTLRKGFQYSLTEIAKSLDHKAEFARANQSRDSDLGRQTATFVRGSADFVADSACLYRNCCY